MHQHHCRHRCERSCFVPCAWYAWDTSMHGFVLAATHVAAERMHLIIRRFPNHRLNVFAAETTYSCPSGGSLNGTTCSSTYTASVNYCPTTTPSAMISPTVTTNSQVSQPSSTSTVTPTGSRSQTATTCSSSCSSSDSLSGGACTNSYIASTTTTYSCSSGTLSGATCTTSYSCNYAANSTTAYDCTVRTSAFRRVQGSIYA
jgi:hypothetical protein